MRRSLKALPRRFPRASSSSFSHPVVSTMRLNLRVYDTWAPLCDMRFTERKYFNSIFAIGLCKVQNRIIRIERDEQIKVMWRTDCLHWRHINVSHWILRQFRRWNYFTTRNSLSLLQPKFYEIASRRKFRQKINTKRFRRGGRRKVFSPRRDFPIRTEI